MKGDFTRAVFPNYELEWQPSKIAQAISVDLFVLTLLLLW
jgi:hypothetical protein